MPDRLADLVKLCEDTLKEQDAFLRERFGVTLAEARKQPPELKIVYQDAWANRRRGVEQ